MTEKDVSHSWGLPPDISLENVNIMDSLGADDSIPNPFDFHLSRTYLRIQKFRRSTSVKKALGAVKKKRKRSGERKLRRRDQV